MRDRSHLARALKGAVVGCPPEEVPRRLCAVLSRALPVDAVTVSLLTDTPSRQLLCASNQMAVILEEVQFTVVEGPCITAAAGGEPVHLIDWGSGARPWPLSAPALWERCPDIAAVHAFPLGAGDGVLGSLDLVSRTPGGMPADVIEEAAEAAGAVAEALPPAQQLLSGDGDFPAWEPADVVRVHWSNTTRPSGSSWCAKGWTRKRPWL